MSCFTRFLILLTDIESPFFCGVPVPESFVSVILLSLRSGIKKENDAYVHSQNRCSFLQNKKSQKSLLVAWYTSDTFTNLNCVRISFPDDTNNNYIVSVTLYVVCVNIKTLYIV